MDVLPIIESDPEAEEVLRDPYKVYITLPLVEVRCAGCPGERSHGEKLAAVWFSPEGPILRVSHWPDVVTRRTSGTRTYLTLFLDKAGKRGLYSCSRHGTWAADIDEIREAKELGFRIGHLRMRLPARPPCNGTRPTADR